MNLSGKRVLITGASRGIGEQLALEFAGAGARVALVARSESTIKELAERLGGTAHPADLSDPDQTQGLIARVEGDGGPIDVLVNNAADERAGALLSLAPSDLVAQVHLNLTAPIELARQAVPGMIQRGGGHIVNVSSLGGTNAVPGVASYSATKAGLSHFTAALRAEFKGTPIKTTLVELGPVNTEMMQHLYDYPPTDRAVTRIRHLGLIKQVAPDHVARNIRQAVEHDRRHVRMPKRGALYPLLVEAPRRITEWLLVGVRP
ncbi:MAG TPA: SDR family NAD(P)-dependent oxidoreductase [Acidimicrobiales bacterium]|nr:SDR family NAD(P)-dependent oxidoreductase [Acidimicrobiales bacterium]